MRKQVLNSDKLISLWLQTVNNLQSGLHARGVEVVQQDNVPRLYAVNNGIRHFFCIQYSPVFRIQ